MFFQNLPGKILNFSCQIHPNTTTHILRAVQKRPHVTWVDNFSKFMARQVPTVAKGIFSSCLWAGEAAFECDPNQDAAFDMQIKILPNRKVKPAMPDDLLTHKDRIVNGLKHVLTNSRNYYDRSLVLKYDVRSIPLKVNTKVFPEMKSKVEDKRNTTAIVYPVRLIDHNIGGNQGLVTILRQKMERQGMHDGTCTHYEILNVDENIYWRTLKVSCSFCCLFYLFLLKSSQEDSEKTFFKIFQGKF
jgi:hypothetical protein